MKPFTVPEMTFNFKDHSRSAMSLFARSPGLSTRKSGPLILGKIVEMTLNIDRGYWRLS